MKQHIRKGAALIAVFVVMLGVVCMLAFGADTDDTTAQAASYPSQVTISWDTWSEYGAAAHYYGSVPMFTINNGAGTAHCVVPGAKAPAASTYTTSPIRCADGALDRTAELVAYLYYGFEGPGFDASIWPSTYYNGQAWTDELYYGMTHVLVSYAFTGSISEACLGCSTGLTAWIQRYIIGLDGTNAYADSVGQQIAQRASRVPDSFQPFLINSSGDGSNQYLVGYIFTPITLSTSALAEETGSNYGYVSDSLTIIDAVSYTGLNVDASYRLSMSVVDAATGAVITDVQGNAVTREFSFTPTDMNGTLNASITFDASQLAGHTLVVYEYLYNASGTLIAQHADINSAQQTILIPSLVTQARGGTSDLDEELATDATVLVDEVSYTNVEAGQEYRLVATLYSSQDEVLLTDENEELVQAELLFVAEDSSGTQEIEIAFDASSVCGQDIVIFEQLYLGNILLAEHADVLSEEQTVSFPSITTKAYSEQSGVQLTDASLDTTIVDTVAYDNLTPDASYVLVSELVYAVNGEAMLDAEGEPVCSVMEFAPEEASGEVQVSMEVPAYSCTGVAVTVMQYLYRDESLVAEHATLGDEDQTIHFVGLATYAHNGNFIKEILAEEDVEVVDKVTYMGLVVGETYRLESALMLVSTGEALLDDNGNPVSTEIEFVAEDSSGEIDVSFTLDASKYVDQELVCFEWLYMDDALIVSHTNLYDEAQTVLCTDTAPALPATGYGSWVLALGTLGACMAGAALRFMRRVRY